ncbi:helix-turn-helix domain-containing protein [Chitinophaga filiformis]|uniref:AraC-type DNA-binding protein n=1 Tax=Chitinophaga filiformis TaxID=104663 RepID=A0A1G7Z950_CHIFI|nr:AraC family transcriptional regulator [Chitinophaga filiformis]SDH05046.1 AraC-type DNA-binding protein [Chitinophaga filiformis]
MNRERKYPDFILLNVGHAVHHADWNWKNICSPFTRIHLVENGTASIIRDGKKYALKKDHLYLTPSYTNHGYECEGHLSLYYIHLYEETDHLPSIFDMVDFPVEIEADPLAIQLIKRLAGIHPDRQLKYYDPVSYDNPAMLIKNIALQKTTPLAFEMEAEGILKQVFSRFLVHASDKGLDIDERIIKTLHHIHANIDKPVNVEELTAMSFLSKDHFIRLFKKSMGCTPGRYISQKKIEKAQRIMLLKDVSIKDLAYSLGFENISYFNRFFKKMTGENPGSYRKKMRLLGRNSQER